MKLQKGKFYKVNDYYDHMKHHAAEYHSTEIIKNTGKKIHNMIIRVIDDDLFMASFNDENIIEQLPDDTEL